MQVRWQIKLIEWIASVVNRTPTRQSAKEHMAGRSRTHDVDAAHGSNIIDKAYNTFVLNSAAAGVLYHASFHHCTYQEYAFIDSWLETREVLIEHVCTDLAQVQSVGFLQISRNPVTLI